MLTPTLTPVSSELAANETPGVRVYEVRRALGPDARHEMSQRAFAALLTRTAKRLRLESRYDSSTVARLESGERRLHLDDVEAIAAVDPLKRGKLWLGWGTLSEEASASSNEQAPRLPAAPTRRVGEAEKGTRRRRRGA